jgi:hypothetical protein
MPLADYIRRRMAGVFDLLITDELHEYKARGSAQGLAAGTLAGACGATLALTGTVFGGYSSTLFYLLWRFSPAVRAEFGYRDEARWVSRYGIVERITKQDPDAYIEDGRHSRRRSYVTRSVEKPGVAPAVLFHLIGNTVFLRLADVARELPPYTERVVRYPLDRGDDPASPSQANCYERLAQVLRQVVLSALHAGSTRLLASYLQALLAYPDACTRGETVVDPVTGSVIAHAPALPEAARYPKERALLELVQRERARGRRVLVYITHTERRDISPRLRTILEREGVRVAVLKADTVAADRREAWSRRRSGRARRCSSVTPASCRRASTSSTGPRSAGTRRTTACTSCGRRAGGRGASASPHRSRSRSWCTRAPSRPRRWRWLPPRCGRR